MSERMTQGEAERGKCLSSAGRHGEREDSGRIFSRGSAIIDHLPPLDVDLVFRSGSAEAVNPLIDQSANFGEGILGSRDYALSPVLDS